MSWASRSNEKCGRPVPKPDKGPTGEEFNEEAVPLQDQIENLRAKISLKERYNKALRDDLQESNLGASSYVHELNKETKELRVKLVEAVRAERSAVQNALRTHREFQLAMMGKPPSIAIPWLDDKLFDMAKLLNCLLDRLKTKRKKLEEAEDMVDIVHKWPLPGSLPWEQEFVATFRRLDCAIEAMKIKRETAQIIHAKYLEIKYQLLSERGKYHSQLKLMEAGRRILKNELSSLETMLDDAIFFKNDAYRNLIITEKEASENRKRRRVQMAKMKKAVEKILEENQRIPNKDNKMIANSTAPAPNKGTADIVELLKAKKLEVEEFQTRAKKIVEIMKVPDLTHIPIRSDTVKQVGNRLREELEVKKNLHLFFKKQRLQLLLIHTYFRYQGAVQEMEFEKYKDQYEKSISEAQEKNQIMTIKLNKYGEIQCLIRTGLMSIAEALLSSDGKKKLQLLQCAWDEDDRIYLFNLTMKIRELVKYNRELTNTFQRRHPEHNYDTYLRQHLQMTCKTVKPPTPKEDDDSDDEDDLVDAKIPNSHEIKAKSNRIVNQAYLKMGNKRKASMIEVDEDPDDEEEAEEREP